MADIHSPAATGSYLLDHGVCAACGRSLDSVQEIAGQCLEPGCPAQICRTCWDLRKRRRCSQHPEPAP